MSNTKLEKVIIRSDYTRRYPDPLNMNFDGDSLAIEHHVLLCRAIDVPSGISKAPNPREQRIDKGIYKKVRESLEDSTDLSFHLKNKGITILAHKVDYSADKKIATVYLSKGEGAGTDDDIPERNIAADGIADGGHTYEIILAAKSAGTCPEGQYVKFEIITGVPKEMSVDITGGLNTAVQVDDSSLLNLEGEFIWIKETLRGEPYADKITYKQNQDGKYDVREILGLLTLFNVNKFSTTQHPKEAYVSKAKCLDLYEQEKQKEEEGKGYKNTFKMLRPILKDILYLHDYVHLKGRERYNEVKSGRAGAMEGVYSKKERNGGHEFIFMGERGQYKLYDGALYPILGAMRYLVEQKPGEDVYSWRLKSFEDVKTFFDEIAPELIAATYQTSLTYGRKPNPIGKDENHWGYLYKTVGFHFVTNYASRSN